MASAACAQYKVVCNAYGGPETTLGQLATTHATQATPAPHGSNALPFTGLDVLLVVGVALILVGLGVALRWATPRRSN